MRTALLSTLGVAATLALGACNSDDATAAQWHMRACDAARISLAQSKGQPTSVDADETDARLQTSETWTYVVKDTQAKTKTTDVYTFNWPAGSTDAASCSQTHTTTTEPLP